MKSAVLLVLCTAWLSAAFLATPSRPPRAALARGRPRASSAPSAPDGGGALFESAGWAAGLKQLNRLPVFVVADERGAPLEAPATYFADVDAGLAALAAARAARSGAAGVVVDLIPCGIGDAWRAQRERRARLVPSAAELEAAGAPPGAEPAGQDVPLFGCLQITKPGGPNGTTPVLPLFMSRADAQRAVDGARALDAREAGEGAAAADAPALEISVLSLSRAIELFATQAEEVGDAAGFEFVPASSSIAFIEDYIRKDSEII